MYTRHPAAAARANVLERGFSGRLLRLYRLAQQFLSQRDGTSVEPAYLLLSTTQGGFPRFGFWLDDTRKDNVGYVDLHERLPLSGRFGAVDQIFPHELMHIIVRQLAGPPPAEANNANQVHAIGVRTDRVTAFNEGLAEHVQVLAVDDPDAQPATVELAANRGLAAVADKRLGQYRRALEAHWSLAPPARIAFALWFSQTEQALRYHAVKANRFAHEPPIDARLLHGDNLHAAYLLENVLPGPEAGPVKSTPRLLATEGVIASLFSRWVTDPAMQQVAPSAELYTAFGIRAENVRPIDHAFLKLFWVLAKVRPHDAAEFIRGYITTFPAESDAVALLARQVSLSWPLGDDPEIWLANDTFLTGTTLFDQYRALPRPHTFDLNGASLVDLLTIHDVSIELAGAIQRGAPYTAVADLARVPGVTGPILERIRAMAAAMTAVRTARSHEDIESVNLVRLFRPVIVRAGVWMVVCAIAAAWLYGRVRPLPAWRLATNGVAASLLSLGPAWILGTTLQFGDTAPAPVILVFVPVVGLGLPGAVWHAVRHRSAAAAALVILAWALTCLPAWLVTVPLF